MQMLTNNLCYTWVLKLFSSSYLLVFFFFFLFCFCFAMLKIHRCCFVVLKVCKVHSVSFHWYDLLMTIITIPQLSSFILCNAQINYVCFAVPPAYYAHLAAFRARYYIEGDSSDSGSTSSGGGNVDIQRLPSIKENVKDVMFYCWACGGRGCGCVWWVLSFEFWVLEALLF